MDQKLLDLKPKRYLCPHCGEWHSWELWHELGYYDSSSNEADLWCERNRPNCNPGRMFIYFSDGYCYYRVEPTCPRGDLYINNKIPIEDIVESSEEPCVTFAVPFTAKNNVGSWACRDCNSNYRCLICKLGDENKSRHMHITFGFEFEQSDYDQFSKTATFVRKERELRQN